jgi:hypothetical protein
VSPYCNRQAAAPRGRGYNETGLEEQRKLPRAQAPPQFLGAQATGQTEMGRGATGRTAARPWGGGRCGGSGAGGAARGPAALLLLRDAGGCSLLASRGTGPCGAPSPATRSMLYQGGLQHCRPPQRGALAQHGVRIRPDDIRHISSSTRQLSKEHPTLASPSFPRFYRPLAAPPAADLLTSQDYPRYSKPVF